MVVKKILEKLFNFKFFNTNRIKFHLTLSMFIENFCV